MQISRPRKIISLCSKKLAFKTNAHKDIAFEFGMWISPKFKLLLIKEFERLKAEEQKQIGWNAKRELISQMQILNDTDIKYLK